MDRTIKARDTPLPTHTHTHKRLTHTHSNKRMFINMQRAEKHSIHFGAASVGAGDKAGLTKHKTRVTIHTHTHPETVYVNHYTNEWGEGRTVRI